MSYHYQTYGQADWFFTGKSPADAPEYVDSSGQKLAPVAPAGGAAPTPAPSAPASSSPPRTSAPPPPMDYEDEGESNLMLYAGIGVGVLALVLIYFKFILGGSDEKAAEVAAEPKKSKPKTIKVEIAMDEGEEEEEA